MELDGVIFMFVADVNECDRLTHRSCDIYTRAKCTNLPGTFTCACKEGYTGDGNKCVG